MRVNMSTSRRRKQKKRVSLPPPDFEELPSDLGSKLSGPFDASPFQDTETYKTYPTGIRGWYQVKEMHGVGEVYMYSIRDSAVYVYKIDDKLPIGKRKSRKKSTSRRR